MFIQEKINEMNEKLKILEKVSHIVIWGAGVHTCKLFEKTNILSYDIKDIVDIDEKKLQASFFGFRIKSPKNILWGDVKAVVISVPGKEREITEILEGEQKFRGIIVSLYEHDKKIPFYKLYNKDVPGICYMGDYPSWDSAEKECRAYDDIAILEKVISSTKKVISGEAVWERDSFLFYEPKYIYSICAAILRCAVQNNNQGVRILDIGGALGSTYFQNRKYLSDVKNLEYVIAEQDCFAEYGRNNLEDDVLKFINGGDDYASYGIFDIVLMSASLQYIYQADEVIHKVLNIQPKYIILDRIFVSDKERICKETVPEEIYKSSYPVRIYKESTIMDFFESKYELIEKDISSVPEEMYFEDGKAEARLYVFQNR